MKRILTILSLLLMTCVTRADTVSLLITVTNAPAADGNTLVLNADTRTWKTTVATPGSQILIGASIGASTTNLFNHLVGAPPTTLRPLWIATNQIKLLSAEGQTITASLTGTWGELALSTNTSVNFTNVRVPLASEANSIRTNVATLLVDGIEDYAQNAFAASAAVLANFVDTSENQTVAGVKTFTGANVHNNASSLFNGGTFTNMVLSYATAQPYYGILFQGVDNYLVAPDSDGIPSIFTTYTVGTSGSLASYTVADHNIVTGIAGDGRYGKKTGANTWTALNTFSGGITNSTLYNVTLTAATSINGTVGWLTNGTWVGATLTNGVNKGAPFQSPNLTDADSTQIGLSAAAAAPQAVAIGNSASAAGDWSTAIGSTASAPNQFSTALGFGATATADYQIRLGTAQEYVSAANDVRIADNLMVGDADNAFVASLAKGLQFIDGTAASADPATGAAAWSASGAIQYRTSGASEGNGGTQWLHNRNAEVVGTGSDYTLTGVYARVDFGGTDVEASLPTAGTYHVIATVAIIGAAVNDNVQVKLYNSTAAADITNSETTDSNVANAAQKSLVIHKLVTVAAASTIQLYAKNNTAARGTIDSLETRIIYIRLH